VYLLRFYRNRESNVLRSSSRCAQAINHNARCVDMRTMPHRQMYVQRKRVKPQADRSAVSTTTAHLRGTLASVLPSSSTSIRMVRTRHLHHVPHLVDLTWDPEVEAQTQEQRQALRPPLLP
jgi:hypothetical protein